MLSERSDSYYSAVTSVEELGHCIRLKRKSLGITLHRLSGLTGIGFRYLSELERGKETAEIGKALRVMRSLGLQIAVAARGYANNGSRHD